MKNADDIALAVIPVLVSMASAPKQSLTYGNLAQIVSIRLGYDVDPHFDLAKPLGIVQDRCEEYGAPCLSALVVNQNTGLPGPGFEPYYRRSHGVVPEMTIEEILTHEYSDIRRYRDWSGFLSSLGLDAESDMTAEAPSEKMGDELAKLYREHNLGKQHVIAAEIGRNTTAREACLKHYGATCQICGFDSLAKYGVPGIIHVHHKVPVADRQGSYDIDPINDLVPLCPNCHALVHSKKRDCLGGYDKEEVYSIEQVQALLELHRCSTGNCHD